MPITFWLLLSSNLRLEKGICDIALTKLRRCQAGLKWKSARLMPGFADFTLEIIIGRGSAPDLVIFRRLRGMIWIFYKKKLVRQGKFCRF